MERSAVSTAEQFQRNLVEVGDEIFDLYIPKLQNDLQAIVNRAERDVVQVVNALMDQAQFQRFIKPRELTRDEIRKASALLNNTPKLDALARERIKILRQELLQAIYRNARKVFKLSHKRLVRVLKGIMPSEVTLVSNIHIQELRELEKIRLEGYTIRKRLVFYFMGFLERVKAGLINALYREASFTQVRASTQVVVRRAFSSLTNNIIVLFQDIAGEADKYASERANFLRVA